MGFVPLPILRLIENVQRYMQCFRNVDIIQMQTRSLYDEILNGIKALQAEAEGKITLKRTVIKSEDKSEVLVVRQKLGGRG